MYCPKCFNETLSLGASGKGDLAINGKHSPSSIFLYNINNQDEKEMYVQLETKIDELFTWYTSFKNISPISTFEIYSSSFVCKNNCSLDPATKISLIGPLIDESKFLQIVRQLAEKHKITLQL